MNTQMNRKMEEMYISESVLCIFEILRYRAYT